MNAQSQNKLSRFAKPYYLASVIVLALVFSFHFAQVRGTLAVSSDLEKSKNNKFEAGEWDKEKKADILISEIYYDTTVTVEGDEFIELFNTSSSNINLFSQEYKLGDEETRGAGEGMYKFPDSSIIEKQKYIVVAKSAVAFEATFNFKPDFEFTPTDDSVPDMIKYNSWATGSLGLNNDGDEVLLLDKDDKPVDVVTYESGTYIGVISHTNPSGAGNSLQRVPKDIDTNDCSLDFIVGTPTPGT
jgi:hypothetical protein